MMVRFAVLLEELRQQVKPLQESRGRELYEDYKANITTAYEGDVRAGVDDGRTRYKVKLGWDDRGYRFSCSCGAAADHVCEHMWATVLTAQEDGWFAGAGGYGGYEEDYDDEYGERWRGTRRGAASSKREKTPRWKQALERLTSVGPAGSGGSGRQPWPASRELVYVIDREETLLGKGIVVEVCSREPKRTGELSKPKAARIAKDLIAELPRDEDRLVVAMLAGGDRAEYGYYYNGESSRYRLNQALARAALPVMCRSGRCLLRSKAFGGSPEFSSLAWGDERPWSVRIVVRPEADQKNYVVEGVLEREGEQRPMSAPSLLTAGGLVFWGSTVEPLEDHGSFHWVVYFREHGVLRVPRADAAELAGRLYAAGPAGGLLLPEELKLEEVRAPLARHLKISAPDKKDVYYSYDQQRLLAELKFEYDGRRVAGDEPGEAIIQTDRRRALIRDKSAEAHAHARLYQLGFRDQYSYRHKKNVLGLAPSKLAKTVAALVAEGWQVQADGKLYRQPGDFKIEVTSGIDWFELHGSVQFGDQVATLPQLLAALRKGESLVTLGDGTVGMLPEEWLKKYGLLAGMGRAEGDHLRFARAQVGVLDALLAAQPQATCDAVFERTRQMLRSFEGVRPAEPPRGFGGELRPYQKDGLGWINFLRDFSFGGCLADDMGLGKTVQVLAMLLARKKERAGTGSPTGASPALIVVPRSLVFNWLAEAGRFAPELRVLDHSHAQRAKATEHFADHDVVLTTYGTLRNDAAYMKDVEFDYVILDEAQAIKN
ncbi:MAG TPA: SNF2-related protein, partial [Tepidisphaeraceae bacterium]